MNTPKKVGELKVQYRPIGKLIPYARNARKHTGSQIDRLAGLITRFGWTNPVLVDGKNGILAGHGRVLAAKKLGHRTVPIIELTGLTATQKREYILADNRIAEEAGWDRDLLVLELGELKTLGADVVALGFGTAEFSLEAEEPVPAAIESKAVTRTGEMWLLGSHHPNQKPVELARRAIANSSAEGELVLDMFAGSASTLLAAEQLKRVGYGIELDPLYVDAGVRRWQALTGKQAHLAHGKKTFDQLAAERNGTKAKAPAR